MGVLKVLLRGVLKDCRSVFATGKERAVMMELECKWAMTKEIEKENEMELPLEQWSDKKWVRWKGVC
jgi:hypothetical protein